MENFSFDKVHKNVSPDLAQEQKFTASGALHNEGMYGDGEDQAGNVYNPATGERFSDTDMLDQIGGKMMSVEEYPDQVKPDDGIEDSSTLSIKDEEASMEEDAAAQWLRKNDI